MKTLIIYDSKHGAVEECADKLSTRINNEIQKVKISKKGFENFDLKDYDNVIIGGSIHAGMLQKSIKSFLNNNITDLLKKKVGLFICTLTHPKDAEHYFDEQFPVEIVKHASAKGCFGGAIYYEKMNFFEKFIIKRITKTDKSFSKIDEKRMDQFIKDF